MKSLLKGRSAVSLLQRLCAFSLALLVAITTTPSMRATGSPQAIGFVSDQAAVMTRALQLFHGLDITGKDGPLEKLSFDLVFLYSEYLAYAAAQPAEPFQTSLPLLPILYVGSD